MDALINGVILTSLNIIESEKGSVMHALKNTDVSYSNFGEAYFSTVNYNTVKGWKKHSEMVCNLIVIEGEVKFVLYDNREDSSTKGKFMEINLSRKNYFRLTIPNKVWFGFKGLSTSENLILNVANILHTPNESVNLPLENDIVKFNW